MKYNKTMTYDELMKADLSGDEIKAIRKEFYLLTAITFYRKYKTVEKPALKVRGNLGKDMKM